MEANIKNINRIPVTLVYPIGACAISEDNWAAVGAVSQCGLVRHFYAVNGMPHEICERKKKQEQSSLP